MSRFIVKGIIVKEPTIKTFKNGVKSITIHLEERLDRVNAYHNVEYNGKFADLIPEDISLLGAEIFATGTLVGKLKGESQVPFENLKGNTFSIIGYPKQ